MCAYMVGTHQFGSVYLGYKILYKIRSGQVGSNVHLIEAIPLILWMHNNDDRHDKNYV